MFLKDENELKMTCTFILLLTLLGKKLNLL